MAPDKTMHCFTFGYFVHKPSAADDVELACVYTAAAAVKLAFQSCITRRRSWLSIVSTTCYAVVVLDFHSRGARLSIDAAYYALK